MKNAKSILCLLLVLGLIFTMPAFLFGCEQGDGEGTEGNNGTDSTDAPGANNTAYTVTIVDNENNPVAGATIMITNSSDVFVNGTTDANGKFSSDTNGSNLGVMIVNLPDGYDKPATVSGAMHATFGESKSITITVNKKVNVTVTYTVKIVDQDNNAVVGAELQLCPNGTCLSDKFVTNDSGVCTKDLSPDLPVDVKIVSLPEGYTKPEAVDANGYHGKIAAGETEIIIKVTKD